MSVMGLVVVDIEDKGPVEIVPYTLDFIEYTPFAKGLETIASAIAQIYLQSDTTFATNKTVMVGAISYPAASQVTCKVGSGADVAGAYILRIIATCASGSVYELIAHFNVVQLT